MFFDFMKLINSYQNSASGSAGGTTNIDINQYIESLSKDDLEALSLQLGVGTNSIFGSTIQESGNSDTFTLSSSMQENLKLTLLQQTLIPVIEDMIDNLKTSKITPTNENGAVSIDDVKNYLINQGEDSSTVSQMTEGDLNAVYNYLGLNSQDLQELNNEALVVDPGDSAQQTVVADSPQTLATGGGVKTTTGGSSTPVTIASPTKNSDDLKAQKEQIIQEYNGKISTEEQTLADLVSQTDSAQAEANNAQMTLSQKLLEVTGRLTASESKVNTLSASVQKANVEINSLQGEFDNLETSGKFSDINSKNQSRKTEITGQLTAKKSELADFEKQLETEKANQQSIQQEKDGVQKDIDTKLDELSSKDPQIKAQIDTAKANIQTLKAEKTTKIAEIDKQIETSEKTEKEDAKTYGSLKGYEQSGITAKMLEYASSPEVKAKWDDWTNRGNGAYCALYVADCVQQAYKDAGMSVRFGHSVLGIKNWGEENNSGIQVSGMSAEQRKDLVRSGKVKPGMAFTYMEGGRMHTGFIKSINADLSWETIEGNTVDSATGKTKTVAGHTRDIYNADLTSLTDWTVRYTG